MPESEANEEQDPELLFRDARAQFEQATELQRRLADLEGRAESSDSRVKATYNQERGLADLQLDPRALRMGSDELRQTILEVSYEAKRDLERQTKEILDESFAEWDLTPDDLKHMAEDPKNIAQTLGDMGKIFEGATKEVEGILEQFTRVLKGTGAASGGFPPGTGGPPGTPPSASSSPSAPEWRPSGHVAGAPSIRLNPRDQDPPGGSRV